MPKVSLAEIVATAWEEFLSRVEGEPEQLPPGFLAHPMPNGEVLIDETPVRALVESSSLELSDVVEVAWREARSKGGAVAAVCHTTIEGEDRAYVLGLECDGLQSASYIVHSAVIDRADKSTVGEMQILSHERASRLAAEAGFDYDPADHTARFSMPDNIVVTDHSEGMLLPDLVIEAGDQLSMVAQGLARADEVTGLLVYHDAALVVDQKPIDALYREDHSPVPKEIAALVEEEVARRLTPVAAAFRHDQNQTGISTVWMLGTDVPSDEDEERQWIAGVARLLPRGQGGWRLGVREPISEDQARLLRG